MTCRSAQATLPLFVEGDLPRRKAARVQRHLDDCVGCREIAAEFRRSQQWLHALPGPIVAGASLERMRRSVQRRLEAEPRPATWRLAIERGWAALRHWTSQPFFAAAALMIVVMGSVAVTHVEGLRGSRLGPGSNLASERAIETGSDESAELSDDPEMVLAQATPEELADGNEGGEAEAADQRAGDHMRIEIQTQDPNVRIIWFAPAASDPATVED
jgi:anti-sigma factor RsiW